jgi:hypothetical protein
MAPIDDALEALRSPKVGESINLTQVADKYRCNRTTLSKRWQGVQGLIVEKYKNARLLNNIQTKELLLYIDALTA